MSTPSADSQARQQQLERALAGSRDGYWERDLLRDIAWYSPSFHELFGLPSGSMPTVRGEASKRVHPDDRERFVQAYRHAIAEIGSFAYEVRFLDGQQAWRWVRGRGRVWPGEDGQARYICGVVTDVHHEKLAQLALQQQHQLLEGLVAERTATLQATAQVAEARRVEAEAANAAKSVFLAQMSHEIRTPLNGVLGLTELALRLAQDPAQRRYLEASLQSGQALLRVISDVLDFSRIEAGMVQLQLHPFDMPQLLAEALQGVMPLVTGRGVALMYDWQGADEWAIGDERCIRQIVNNLIGNAAKFTERGHIQLCGSSRPLAEGRLQLEIRVQDTGSGIPAAQRERVFEAFVQADERLSRAHGGTGLGLSIARRLARAMGGDLTLDPSVTDGTAMVVTLPVQRLPGDAAATPAPRHVWLVYPRKAAGDWMVGRFQRQGSGSSWFPTLAGAVQAAQRLPLGEAGAPPAPDLVLISEPALAGDAALAPLREALPHCTLLLAIRPDWYQPAVEAEARALDIGNVVVPFTPATLRRMLTGVRGAPDKAPTAVRLRSGAQVLLVEDNPVNQLVGTEFLRALGLQVQVANEGNEAIAACQAQPPDLVLMDLQMPGMDGLEATRRLRDMQREKLWPGAPIVALTAHAGDADRAACEAVGMDAVLTKPLTMDSLQRELARWLAA